MNHFQEIKEQVEQAKKESKEQVSLNTEQIASLLWSYERYEKFYALAEENLADSEYDPLADLWVAWEEEKTKKE